MIDLNVIKIIIQILYIFKLKFYEFEIEQLKGMYYKNT